MTTIRSLLLNFISISYSIFIQKIKKQTRKLVAGCSKHCFEIVDGTDVVSILHIRQGDIDVI
ncbi:hypothetical protein AZK16_00890 [Streptococcus pneumoniae]|nr:hypothetical protein AZK16_00890 [Streptococcus pneumoniae]